MSCEAGFTGNPCKDQETANLRGVAPHNALRLLEDSLETAQDILKSSIERAADRLEAFEQILDFVEDPEDDKCVNVDKSSIVSVGFTLTLRQLFYQFVSRPALGLANTFEDYKRLGRTVTDARRAGLIDWDAIEDRTRNVRRLPAWNDPSEIVSSCASQYREDAWRSQLYRPENWIEKDALTGVIEGVSEEFRAPWFSCRGNVSDSEMSAAGKRFRAVLDQGQVPLILQLVDHDPTGLDMTRDIRERLAMFAGEEIEVRRIALNISQTAGLPPNYAKESDARYPAYVKQFGTADCWELDALAPNVISGLVRAELNSLIDRDAWARAIADEDDNRAILTAAADNWSLVKSALRAAP